MKPVLECKDYSPRQKYGQSIKSQYGQSSLISYTFGFPEAMKSPVYRYLVTYTPSKAADSSTCLPYPSRFSFHMMDSLAFFGGLQTALGTTTPKDEAFQRTLTKYFIQFAKEGKHHLLSQEYAVIGHPQFSAAPEINHPFSFHR